MNCDVCGAEVDHDIMTDHLQEQHQVYVYWHIEEQEDGHLYVFLDRWPGMPRRRMHGCICVKGETAGACIVLPFGKHTILCLCKSTNMFLL